MEPKPRSHSRWNSMRMECRIFQGSKPIAASTTPTRIDSRISRNATDIGVPPRKRVRPSLAAGNSLVCMSLVSWGIGGLRSGFASGILTGEQQMGNQLAGTRGYQNFIFVIFLQHPLQRVQSVGLARRLVPAQPINARKAHCNARFVSRRALQSL